MDLKEFTQKRRPGQVCRTCAVVPGVLRDEIAEARAGDVPPGWATIAAWLLEEHGIKVSGTSLRNHFTTPGHCTGEE